MTTSTGLEGSAFSRLMAGPFGRLARAGLGVAIIGTGMLVGGTTGLIVGALGLVPIAAGTFNLCPVAPLWGGHFFGSAYCGRRA